MRGFDSPSCPSRSANAAQVYVILRKDVAYVQVQFNAFCADSTGTVEFFRVSVRPWNHPGS